MLEACRDVSAENMAGFIACAERDASMYTQPTLSFDGLNVLLQELAASLELCSEQHKSPDSQEVRQTDLAKQSGDALFDFDHLDDLQWNPKMGNLGSDEPPYSQGNRPFLKSIWAAMSQCAVVNRWESSDVVEIAAQNRAWGLPVEANPQTSLLVEQLRLMVAWKLMPTTELIQECMERGVSVTKFPSGQYSSGHSHREELLQHLVESLWNQAFANSRIPVDRLANFEAAADMFEKVQQLQTMDLNTLKVEYKSYGVSPEVGMDKQELMARLRNLIFWERLSLTELQRECEEHGIPIDCGKHLRRKEQRDSMIRDLFENQCMDAWTAHGVPAKKLGWKSSSWVLAQLTRLERLSDSALEREYTDLSLPLVAGLQRQDILRRLKDVFVWEKLPLADLGEAAQQRKIPMTGLPNGEAEQRNTLLDRLLASICVETYEAKAIPMRRLWSVKAAAELEESMSRIEESTLSDLMCEHSRLGLPPAIALVTRDTLIERLKLALLWDKLPVIELRIECQTRSISTDGFWGTDAEERRELVERLLVAMFADTYEKRGIPVKRLGSFKTATAFIEKCEFIQNMSERELQTESHKLGLSSEKLLKKEDLIKRIINRLLWEELPLCELRKECQDQNVPTSGIKGWGMEVEERRELVQRLLVSVSADTFEQKGVPARRLGSSKVAEKMVEKYEHLKSLSSASLKVEYAQLNLPAEPDLSDDEVMCRLRTAFLWKELPLLELRKECGDRNINFSELKGSEADQQRALIERLLISLCTNLFEGIGLPVHRLGTVKAASKAYAKFKALERMSTLDVKREVKKLGIPSHGVADEELVSRIKTVYMWMEVPLGDLQAECRLARIPFTKSDSQLDLAQRLLEVQWSRREAKSGPQRRQAQQQKPRSASPPLHTRTFPCSSKIEGYFRILRLQPDATLADVKKAYKQLALKHHPDKNDETMQEQAAAEFRDVAQAYQALCDYFG